jgi:hypothetical protein
MSYYVVNIMVVHVCLRERDSVVGRAAKLSKTKSQISSVFSISSGSTGLRPVVAWNSADQVLKMARLVRVARIDLPNQPDDLAPPPHIDPVDT